MCLVWTIPKWDSTPFRWSWTVHTNTWMHPHTHMLTGGGCIFPSPPKIHFSIDFMGLDSPSLSLSLCLCTVLRITRLNTSSRSHSRLNAIHPSMHTCAYTGNISSTRENYTGGWIKNGWGKSVRENVRRIGWTKEIKGWGMGETDSQRERERGSILRADGVELEGFQSAELLSLSKRPIWSQSISHSYTHTHTPLLYIPPVNIAYTLSGKVPLIIHPVNITQT